MKGMGVGGGVKREGEAKYHCSMTFDHCNGIPKTRITLKLAMK